MRGSLENLISLYNGADAARLPVRSVIGAFVALSPNASELSNYAALDQCIRITNREVPVDAPVRAYPLNRQKALHILGGAEPEWVLGGLKVRAFYFNTLNPDCSEHVTVDGHMLGAWCNQRLVLRRHAQIHGKKEYEAIVKDFQTASSCQNISAPRFQAILWLAWKRKHRILYNPQLKFEWEENQHT